MIFIDYKDRRPIYEQITEKVEELIMLGAMKEDEALPSVRQLAIDLSINPNTIQRSYAELERHGSIYSVKGKGSFVASSDKLKKTRIDTTFHMLDEVIKASFLLGIGKQEIINYINDYNWQRGGSTV